MAERDLSGGGVQVRPDCGTSGSLSSFSVPLNDPVVMVLDSVPAAPVEVKLKLPPVNGRAEPPRVRLNELCDHGCGCLAELLEDSGREEYGGVSPRATSSHVSSWGAEVPRLLGNMAMGASEEGGGKVDKQGGRLGPDKGCSET